MHQSDNSLFCGIVVAGNNQLAKVEMDNPTSGERKHILFDMLELNVTIQNIKSNIAKCKPESIDFHETELHVFELALQDLRASKNKTQESLYHE